MLFGTGELLNCWYSFRHTFCKREGENWSLQLGVFIPVLKKKDGKSGTENIHSKVELITELKPGARPTQKKSMEYVAYCDGSIISYQIKSTQLYNCSRGGRRHLKLFWRKKIGMPSYNAHQFLQLSSSQIVLQVHIPTLKAHLFASSNLSSSVPSSYVRHKKIKKQAYEERLHEVEHATSVPTVFTITGGRGKLASAFYKQIAFMLAEKISKPYASRKAYIHCRLSFALLKANVMCMHGSCSLCSACDNFRTPQWWLLQGQTSGGVLLKTAIS